jgi:hypothetical protein
MYPDEIPYMQEGIFRIANLFQFTYDSECGSIIMARYKRGFWKISGQPHFNRFHIMRRGALPDNV